MNKSVHANPLLPAARRTALSAGWVLLLAAVVLGGSALENPSFEDGKTQPRGWRLEGKGAWATEAHTGRRAASVTGTGKDSSFWRTTGFRFAPSTLYRVAVWAKAERTTGGCVITGPSFCNRDFGTHTDWQRHAFAFITPAEPGDAYLRFGQWHVGTTVTFDDVELRPTQAVHASFGPVVLGAGEEIDGAEYRFAAPLGGEGANHARTLQSFRCGFNSNRWCFHDGASVVYRFAIPGRRQTAASVEANCNYHSSGAGFIDASTDGAKWTTVARFDKVSPVRAELPKSLFPAEAVLVRFRAAGKETDTRNSKPGDFQLNAISYRATLDAPAGPLRGSTAYLDVATTTPDFSVAVLALPSAEGGSDAWRVAIGNRTAQAASLQVAATVASEKGAEPPVRADVAVPAGATREVTLATPLRHAGTNALTLTVRSGGREVYRASAERRLASLHDASYGYALPSAGPCALWWCEGTHKVSRSRALPAEHRPIVEMAAARNDHEPVQIVLRPKAELKNVRVRVAPLTAGKAALAPERVTVRQVGYVNVTHPTDGSGCRGWWPDPLPLFEQGCTLEAGRNHPLWISIAVPPDQTPGLYSGTVELRADGWQASVPLRLRVWDFALPKATHLQTGFGLRVGTIRRYHNLETTDELRAVLDLYHQDFAAHRIAPYDPAPLDPIGVDFSTGPWEGGSFDTADAKEGRRCLKVVDNSERSSIAAGNTTRIPVDPKAAYAFSWWAKTAKAGQPYLVTLQQYDAAGKWIWGNNIDFARTGSGKWQHEEAAIPANSPRPLNARAKSVQVALRPAPYSDQGEHTGTAWFDDIRFGLAPKGPNLVADGGFEQAVRELKATVDFTAWDKAAARTLGDLGFNAFRYVLRGMGGGTFHSRRKGRIGAFEQGTPEYEKLMASQGRQVVEHFRAKGWLDRAYMYWFDEPAPKDYAFVAEGMDLIKRAAPGLTRMLTEQPEGPLCGHVDLWCPVLSSYDLKIGAERQKAGERFWWYLCCGPRAPYIGLFIDHPAVDLRVWAWLSRKWNIQGQLVWTSNYWTSSCAFPPPKIQNPWADPMSYVSGYDRPPGHIGYWGNGDGRFVYPPNRDVAADRAKHLGGPVPSLRWEMLREGIEDYETFWLLDQLIARARKEKKAPALAAEAEKLAGVPDEVIADGKTYSKDPQPLLRHRQKVAEMIERLSAALR